MTEPRDHFDRMDRDEAPELDRVAAVAMDPPSPRAKGDLASIARSLFDALQAIQKQAGWRKPIHVAYALGCDKPHPESWKDADPADLRRSAEIVDFVRELVSVDLPSEVADFELQRIARERFIVTVDALRRTKQRIPEARLVLTQVVRGEVSGTQSHSPLQLVDDDNYGGALQRVKERYRSWIAPIAAGKIAFEVVPLSEESELPSWCTDENLAPVHRPIDQIRAEIRDLFTNR